MAQVQMSMTAWGHLPVKYSTDKIPPGWHVGCGWEYRKYRDMCNEWRILSEAMSDKQGKVGLYVDKKFEFKQGAKEVIKGWDMAVATMNKGEHATFVIRGDLAYGEKVRRSTGTDADAGIGTGASTGPGSVALVCTAHM